MIFPAGNLHLWLGFSMAMLNNQMGLHAKIHRNPNTDSFDTLR